MIQSRVKSKDKFVEFIAQLLSYSGGKFDDNVKQHLGIYFPTDEQVLEYHRRYTDVPIELHADFWVRSFLREYYPDSAIFHNARLQRDDQKKRLWSDKKRV